MLSLPGINNNNTMQLSKTTSLVALAAGIAMSASAQSQGDPILFGYQNNMYDSSASKGIYIVPPTGQTATLLWEDPFAYTADGKATGNIMVAGWLRNGVLCGYESQYPAPSQTYYKYVERDLESGELKREIDVDLSDGWTNCFLNAAYCPVDDRIYGYGFNAERTGFAFKSAPASKPNQAVIIREVGTTYPGSITYNHELGTFYCINSSRNDYDYTYTYTLASIDINTGAQTTVYSISPGATSDYKCIGGLIWVPARQAYLWNFYTMFDGTEPCSQLVELNPEKKTTTTVKSFDVNKNFYFFVSENNEPVAAVGAPGVVTDVKTEIISGNNARISFNLPQNMADGKAISGNVNYTIYVDGKAVTADSGAAGAAVSYNTTLTDGTHFIRVVASVNGVAGLGEINMLYVGEDSPCAPENVVLTETELKWDAVTEGIAGNPLTSVTYRVAINGMTIAETSSTSVDVKDVINPNGTLTNYRAEVWAIYSNRESKAGVSNPVIAGRSWTVPFTVLPDPAQYSVMEQEDTDNNGVWWSLDAEEYTGKYALTSGFSRYEASEDWIFLPRFTAADNKVYSLSFDAYLADMELSGGKVQAWIGDGPSKSNMKQVLVPGVRILSSAPDRTFTAEFMADGELAGKDLYIGICVTSEAGTLSPLRFQNLSVNESANATIAGPKAVTALTAVPTGDDKSQIKVTFTLPTETLAGNKIDASSTVDASVAIQGAIGAPVKTSGKPGETVSVTLDGGTADYVVTVTPSCNNVVGLAANCVSSLGYSLPGLVRNVRTAYDRDNMSLLIEWDAPDTDINGNPMEGEQLSYNIWAYNSEVGGYELAVNVPYPLQLATMTMEESSTLQNVEVGISAVSALGESPNLKRVTCQVGSPFQLPIEDDFNGEEFKFGPITNYVLDPYTNTTIGWGSTSSKDFGLTGGMIADMGDVLCGYPSKAGSMSRIDLPKVSTTGYSNVKLILNIWTGEDAATTTVKGNYPGSETIEWEGVSYAPMTEVEIETIPTGNGYQEVTIEFPYNFNGQPWINAIIESVYPSMSSRFILAGYSLEATVGVNGVTETLYGTITGRNGMVTVNGYEGKTVNVYTLDGKLAATATVAGTSFDIPVAPGIYVVKVADRVAKVVVK